jgi:hypothetical protein
VSDKHCVTSMFHCQNLFHVAMLHPIPNISHDSFPVSVTQSNPLMKPRFLRAFVNESLWHKDSHPHTTMEMRLYCSKSHYQLTNVPTPISGQSCHAFSPPSYLVGNVHQPDSSFLSTTVPHLITLDGTIASCFANARASSQAPILLSPILLLNNHPYQTEIEDNICLPRLSWPGQYQSLRQQSQE